VEHDRDRSLQNFALFSCPGGDISPALAGFVMQYSGMLTSAISAIIQTYSQLEIAMNSMERVTEYCELEQAPAASPSPSFFPARGDRPVSL
jgi:ABC-type multidrug transport system fused ATPase/permease subunit